MRHYYTMRALIAEARRAYNAEVGRTFTLLERFSEQGGDGDEPSFNRCDKLLLRCEALEAAAESMPDDRTDAERDADREAQQDAWEDAAERRADRETRRAESGYCD